MKTTISWDWTEAFSKFGFNDGDEWNGTELVADALRDAGYEVECDGWGMHNYCIQKLTSPEGVELIGKDGVPGHTFGYDDARTYLPAETIALLDAKFPEDGIIEN